MTVTASFEQFSKKRGGRFAVQELTFDVQAGRVVGLIGPNGAGKSTALAGLTGLVEPTSGRATVFGTDYRSLRRPATKVGVNLDGMDIEPGLTGLRHLQICQLAAGAERQAVDQILEQVDLAAEAKKKVRDYSLGMRQRLGGIASALIGRPPQLLVLDEPANGLDPEASSGCADSSGTSLLPAAVRWSRASADGTGTGCRRSGDPQAKDALPGNAEGGQSSRWRKPGICLLQDSGSRPMTKEVVATKDRVAWLPPDFERSY